MREDSIVAEVRKFRELRAAKFGYRLQAIAEDAKKREREGGRRVVSLAKPKCHALRPEA